MFNICEKNNGFTLDSSFLITAYKNRDIIYHAKKILDGSKIIINEVALNEVDHKGFPKAEILLKIKQIFGQVIVKDVTNNERLLGQQLEMQCNDLHPGDSAILAFTKKTSTILATMDKGLAKSCNFFNVGCALFYNIKKFGWDVIYFPAKKFDTFNNGNNKNAKKTIQLSDIL